MTQAKPARQLKHTQQINAHNHSIICQQSEAPCWNNCRNPETGIFYSHTFANATDTRPRRLHRNPNTLVNCRLNIDCETDN